MATLPLEPPESEFTVPNRLANESSPYLLQHKDNPVDWFPWGEDAFAKAQDEDKPVIVSIGYSACHWCHVMEHESFEDPATATLMNERFVSIKVDREERPDVDSLYMTAVQALSGHGGWPLNVFLTPSGVPFFGGTYWPSEDRQGMPGFMKVLDAVAGAFTEKRADVEQTGEQLATLLRNATKATPTAERFSAKTIESALANLARLFDGEHGGFGGAPKFPQPSILEFLLRTTRTGDERSRIMLATTLDNMAVGGIYDQVGGGFHRYAVDDIWLVPHFEKMLYDNAQLAQVYLDGWLVTGTDTYRRIATETLDYVVREMTAPEGGFYSTQDADTEGEEGKFYVWANEEVERVVGPEDAAIVAAYYGVEPGGNFEGHTILSIVGDPSTIARERGIAVGDVLAAVERARPLLYAARQDRVSPGRDDKIITSWNGMMLRTFANAGRFLDRDDYLDVARRNAGFLLATLRADGRLLHTYKDGWARINGMLEDYANLVDGLLALYQGTLETRWLDEAVALANVILDEFTDTPETGFFDTGIHHERLIARPRDLQDGATPSGNAVAAGALMTLARYTDNDDFRHRAVGILSMMATPMANHPLGFGRYLSAVADYIATPREIVIAAPSGATGVDALASVASKTYAPNTLLALADPGDQEAAVRYPLLGGRVQRDGQPTAYLCERAACLPPTNDPGIFAQQFANGTGIVWSEL